MIKFKHTIVYWLLLGVLIYTIGWNMVKASLYGDPSSFLVLAIEIFLFVSILVKHEFTIIACYTWAAYFILKGGIMIVLLCLEHAHNDFALMESGTLQSQGLKLVFGICIILYTRWGIEYISKG